MTWKAKKSGQTLLSEGNASPNDDKLEFKNWGRANEQSLKGNDCGLHHVVFAKPFIGLHSSF